MKKIFGKQEKEFPKEIMMKYDLDYGSSVDGTIRFFGEESVDTQLARYEKELDENIAASYEKEKSIINSVDIIEKARTGDYPPEERYGMIVKSLTTLVDNDVKLTYWVKPSELACALDYFDEVAKNSSNSPEASRLEQEIVNVREILGDKKKLEKYLCETSPEVFARIYFQRTIS